MHRLFRLLHRWKCKNAAHKLALDALSSLPDDLSNSWSGMFLWHVEAYLRGVDAPENEFRDYANHVLYPRENWGGAARLARKWYWRTVESLRCKEWSEAAYHAGVLCRYSSFPAFPLRTDSDEFGLSLSALVEWNLSQLYDRLTAGVDKFACPSPPRGEDWLEDLLRASSIEANRSSETVKARFNLPAIVEDPNSLDGELLEVFAHLLRQARATLGIILGRALSESGVEPPHYPLGVAATLAVPSLPLFWLTRSQSAAANWKIISAMSREFTQSGEIKSTLPASAVALRDAFSIEIQGQTPAGPSVGLPGQGTLGKSETESLNEPQRGPFTKSRVTTPPSKPRLADAPITETSPPSEASSISAEVADNLALIGIETIRQLLDADAEDIASNLGANATASDVVAWQDEARLCCELRGLAPAEAQLLVACGVTGAEDLAALEPVELWELVSPVAESPDGRRLLQGDPPPDINTVTRWIEAANRLNQAA